MKRDIVRTLRGIATQDGAGVKLTRIIGQPAQGSLDPFLMLDFFGSDTLQDYLAGFPSHPHRGFQTVTYMLAGRMRHRDSVGNDGVIEAGGIQWMNAGRGIVHEELPEQEDGLLQGFQLWVNLPAAQKMSAPGYQDIPSSQVPEVALASGKVRVLAGWFGEAQGPVATQAVAPLFLDLHLSNDDMTVPIPDGHTAFLYCYDDTVLVAGKPVTAGELAILERQGDVQVAGAGKAIVVAGAPLGEPVVQHGPFVMNTAEEIREAIADFQAGRLG